MDTRKYYNHNFILSNHSYVVDDDATNLLLSKQIKLKSLDEVEFWRTRRMTKYFVGRLVTQSISQV